MKSRSNRINERMEAEVQDDESPETEGSSRHQHGREGIVSEVLRHPPSWRDDEEEEPC